MSGFRNALSPTDDELSNRLRLSPSTQADGSPNTDATAGWQQAYADWQARGHQMGTMAEWLRDVPMQGLGFVGGIKAYHGSPHSFPAEAVVKFADGRAPISAPLGTQLHPDIVSAIQSGEATVQEHPLGRFRLDKIGTGEGAQAYGHGLYFAENEGVARSYRDALRWKGSDWNDPQYVAKYWLDANKGDANAAASYLEGSLKHQSTPEAKAAVTGAVDLLRSGGSGIDAANPGHMYEVNINADPEHFLHWDKRMSDQSPQVQAALEPLLRPNGKPGPGQSDFWLSNPTGREAYQALSERMAPPQPPDPGGWGSVQGGAAWGDAAHDPAAASLALQQAGIPGIRYLDQGSRGAGEGSHNAVVFDPATIEILRKYGLAGLGLGGAAAATAGQQTDDTGASQ